MSGMNQGRPHEFILNVAYSDIHLSALLECVAFMNAVVSDGFPSLIPIVMVLGDVQGRTIVLHGLMKMELQDQKRKLSATPLM